MAERCCSVASSLAIRAARPGRWRAQRSPARAPPPRWSPTPTRWRRHAISCRPAAAAGAGLAHLLAEPRRCRRAAGTPDLTLPHGRQARAPIAWPAPQRVPEGSADDLRATPATCCCRLPMTPRRAGRDSVQAHANWLVCKDICVPEEGDFRLDLPGGTRPPPRPGATVRRIRPAGAARLAVAGRRRRRMARCSVQGPELTPATVLDAWFIPDTPGMIRDNAAQPLTVWRRGFTLALRPGKAFQPDGGLSGRAGGARPRRLETDVLLRARPGTGAAAARPIAAAAHARPRVPGRADPQPDAVRVPGAGDEGGRPGRRRRAARRTRQAARLYRRGAGGVRRLWAARCWRRGPPERRRAGGSSSSRRRSSPPWPGCCSRSGLNLSGVSRSAPGLTRTGHGLARTRRPYRQLLHRTAGGGGGDALHRAVHGRRHCRRARRAAGGDHAGVPGHGSLGSRRHTQLLARVPALWRAAPKPGRWMEVLRQALAFPMYGASAWLVWVISQEAGPSGVLATAAGLVLLGFAGLGAGHRPDVRRIAAAASASRLAAAALLAALAVLSGIAATPGASSAAGGSGRRAVQSPRAWPRCATRDGRCSST